MIEKPQLWLDGSPQVAPGGSGYAGAYLSLNGEPLAGHTISFSVSGPAALQANSGTTAPDGYTGVAFTGTREGTATITATCNVTVTTDAGRSVTVPLSESFDVRIGSGAYLELNHAHDELQGGESMTVGINMFEENGMWMEEFDFTVDLSGPGSVNKRSGSAAADDYNSDGFTLTAANEDGTIVVDIATSGQTEAGQRVSAAIQLSVPVAKTPTWHGTLTYQSPPDVDNPIWKWLGAELLIDFVFDEPFRWRDNGTWRGTATGSCTAVQSLNGLTATDYTAYNGLAMGDLTHTFTLLSAFEPTTLYYELAVISSSYSDWVEFDFDMVAGDNEHALLYEYEFHEYYEGISEWAGPVHGESNRSFSRGGELRFFIPNLPGGELKEGTFDIYAFRETPSYNLNKDIYRDSIHHWYGGEEFSCTLELELID